MRSSFLSEIVQGSSYRLPRAWTIDCFRWLTLLNLSYHDWKISKRLEFDYSSLWSSTLTGLWELLVFSIIGVAYKPHGLKEGENFRVFIKASKRKNPYLKKGSIEYNYNQVSFLKLWLAYRTMLHTYSLPIVPHFYSSVVVCSVIHKGCKKIKLILWWR